MPHRRIPNTDVGRLKALKDSWEKSQNCPVEEMAIVPKTLDKLNKMHIRFDKELTERGSAKSAQVDATSAEQSLENNLRMYVSHFIRVFNMGVGMIAMVAPEDVDGVLEGLSRGEAPGWVMGEVEVGEGVRWA